jgi:uncharacterized protein (DUF302 family)
MCKLHFADDIDFMAKIEIELQELITLLENVINKSGMAINIDKSKILVNSNSDHVPIKVTINFQKTRKSKIL